MERCVFCQAELTPDARFCRVCGREQKIDMFAAPPSSSGTQPAPAPASRMLNPGCPSCGQPAQPADRFCMRCAFPLRQRCSQCGQETPIWAAFCPQCAHPLTRLCRQAGSPTSREIILVPFVQARESLPEAAGIPHLSASPQMNTTVPTALSGPQSGTPGVPSAPLGTQTGLRLTWHLSRRQVLAGLAGLAVVGSGATLVALLPKSQREGATSGPTATLPATPVLPPNLSYTYYDSYGIFSVAWSPDGKHIASGNADNMVQVLDAATGESINIYGNASNVEAIYTVAWSPDGKLIASGSSDHSVQVRDATTGEPIYTYTGHAKSVDAVAWSPDGKHIASASPDGTVQVWDAMTGANIYTYTFSDPDFGICTMAWSPRSQHIALGTRSLDTIQVWDAATGRQVSVYTGHPNGVDAVAWSPNGKRVASGDVNNIVQVWDAITGGHVYTYTDHTGPIQGVSWSPDGKYIASASNDATVRVWGAG